MKNKSTGSKGFESFKTRAHMKSCVVIRLKETAKDESRWKSHISQSALLRRCQYGFGSLPRWSIWLGRW